MDIIVVVCKDADCQYFEIKAFGLRLNVFIATLFQVLYAGECGR